jgi:exonuclease III
MNKILSLLLIIIAALQICGSQLHSQDTVRVVSYNLLNYPAFYPERNPYFAKVMNSLKPDIVVIQELASIVGINVFLNEVLNLNDSGFVAGTFKDGPDTDNALFYRDSVFNFLGNKRISTNLRDINEFKLVHETTNDTILIYSVHLKANQGDSQQRAEEVAVLRVVTDNLPTGAHYIVLGDFNIYSAFEPAFQALLNTDKTGYVLDPINKNGTWHNNTTYANIHTQSTRTRPFGDGATGGLDDRFDMILISQAVKDAGCIQYLSGSYQTYGNDGFHFNDSINAMPNAAVSKEIADALHYASDHLPVAADFVFYEINSIAKTNEISYPQFFHLSQNYPNPFNPSTTIEFDLGRSAYVSLEIFNTMGEKVSTLVSDRLPAGNYRYMWNISKQQGMASGIYFYRLTVSVSGATITNLSANPLSHDTKHEFLELKKMVLMK